MVGAVPVCSGCDERLVGRRIFPARVAVVVPVVRWASWRTRTYPKD